MSGPTQNGFQGTVNVQPAPAEAGDFASRNPRAVALSGPGQFVAPDDGVAVGRFCWVDTNTGTVSQSYVPGYQIGFIHRNNQAVIVEFLGFNTMQVLAGLPVTPFIQGDFWATFAGGATPGH